MASAECNMRNDVCLMFRDAGRLLHAPCLMLDELRLVLDAS